MKKYFIIIPLLIIIVFFISYFLKPSTQQHPIEQKLSLNSYAGKWYINKSTFPMWLKGDKKNPTFNYTIETKDSTQVLHGDVQYFKDGKLKHIEGIDQPLNEFNTAFIWRGNGLLKLFKSKWEIVAYNEQEQWAIMHFQKTIFTPEGYDVFSKEKQLNKDARLDVQARLDELGINRELKVIPQE
ncbi:MAG: hypothetical protein JWN78_1030 [Bacteroidota bacterium]|nr:hypothetical protein [Bacteroidota bacterium]